MRFLDRLGPAPHGTEVDHLTVVLRDLTRPDRLHRLDPLAQQLPARRKVGSMVRHLLAVPAAADAEDEPAVRDLVDTRDLLGSVDRIALDEKADAGGDANRLARQGGDRQRDERIHRVPVLLR